MANYCYSTYRITGEASELDALYELMSRLEKEKENGNWVGHIVEALNEKIPEHLYVRGWWNELEREEDCISFSLESAWDPIYEAWDFICFMYDSLSPRTSSARNRGVRSILKETILRKMVLG